VHRAGRPFLQAALALSRNGPRCKGLAGSTRIDDS